jgi:hypothetical protein
VLVSVTSAGREVVDHATARRRELLAEILGRLPARQQTAVAAALQTFADAAGEVPDSQWPAGSTPAQASPVTASPAGTSPVVVGPVAASPAGTGGSA